MRGRRELTWSIVVPTAGLGARRFGTDKGTTGEQGLTVGQSGGEYAVGNFAV